MDKKNYKTEKKYYGVIVHKIWSMSMFHNDETITHIKLFKREKDAEEYKSIREQDSTIRCEIKDAYL